uniref:Uncharacterized protein n=1 Tax=Arundo donax TaxID=35708 RepID=A0A0A9BQ07_ARUDO
MKRIVTKNIITYKIRKG